VGAWDVVATGVLGAGLLRLELAVPATTVPKWTAQNGFDTGIRSTLRLGSEGGRQAAALTSEVLVYALMLAPFLNATLVAGVEHERWDVGWRLLVLDAETLPIATTVTLSPSTWWRASVPSSRNAGPRAGSGSGASSSKRSCPDAAQVPTQAAGVELVSPPRPLRRG
jgi:hypothetical protein